MTDLKSFTRRFPLYFYVFLTFFIFIKFIFIFFLRSAYAPDFIFELTPFYLLAGFDNLHLLFLSLFVILTGAYLHYKYKKRNLLLSFIPSIVILIGVGAAISTKNLNLSNNLLNIVYYVIFGCLLFIILIDHRQILQYDGSLEIKEIRRERPALARSITKAKPSIGRQKTPRSTLPVLSAIASLAKRPRKTRETRIKKEKRWKLRTTSSLGGGSGLSPTRNFLQTGEKKLPQNMPIYRREPVAYRNIPPRKISGKRHFIKREKSTSEKLARTDLKKAQNMLDEFERKSKKLNYLEKEIELRRKNLVKQEQLLTNKLISPKGEKTSHGTIPYFEPETTPAAIGEKHEVIPPSMVFDEIKVSAAIVHRCMLKKINTHLTELLGYDIQELVNKSLLNFVLPESLSKIENFYLKRLKGEGVSSYEAIFLTKDNQKITFEIEAIPTTFNDEKADILIFKKREDN